jgi:hypothetical protein
MDILNGVLTHIFMSSFHVRQVYCSSMTNLNPHGINIQCYLNKHSPPQSKINPPTQQYPFRALLLSKLQLGKGGCVLFQVGGGKGCKERTKHQSRVTHTSRI